MTNSSLTIERVETLTGHTSPETAYLVDDYPYGVRLRCKIRYWVETATRGAAKGEQRFTSQTTNPKADGEVWNKPKSSTYSPFVVMYLDDKQHVQHHHIPTWITGKDDVRARAMGIYDALTDAERGRYEAMLAYSRRVNPTTWAEWEATVQVIADHILITGREPELDGNSWQAPSRLYYLPDPAAYVTAARQLLAAS